MKKQLSLYFVRHGETYFNLYDRTQGWGNTPLTSRGISEARKSGKGLSNLKFDAVYTSDLLRTIETAELMLEESEVSEKDHEIIAMPELREYFFGSYEGGSNSDAFQSLVDYLGYDDIEDLLENVNPIQRMDVFHEIDPYGHAESSADFLGRLNEGLDQIIEKHEGTNQNILIVAHGGTILSLLKHLIPELEDPESLKNGSVSVIQYEDGGYHLDRYGDTTHFVKEQE